MNFLIYEYFLGKNVCMKFILMIFLKWKYFFIFGVSKLFYCYKKENNKGRIIMWLFLK